MFGCSSGQPVIVAEIECPFCFNESRVTRVSTHHISKSLVNKIYDSSGSTRNFLLGQEFRHCHYSIPWAIIVGLATWTGPFLSHFNVIFIPLFLVPPSRSASGPSSGKAESLPITWQLGSRRVPAWMIDLLQIPWSKRIIAILHQLSSCLVASMIGNVL